MWDARRWQVIGVRGAADPTASKASLWASYEGEPRVQKQVIVRFTVG